MTQSIVDLALDEIIRGDNDRTEFDDKELLELAESIAAHGLAQPITVRPLVMDQGTRRTYRIVAGERRYRAHLLYMEKVNRGEWMVSPKVRPGFVKAIIRPDLDDEAERDIMLIENVNRVDLNPLDEGRAYDKRASKLDGSDNERNSAIAAKVGKSPQYIADRRSLLKLVEDVQFHLKKGTLPIGHALLMVRLDSNRQRMALSLFNRSGKLSQNLFAEICRQLYDDQVQEAQKGLTLFDMGAWESWVDNTKDIPRRGRKAVVAVPKRSDLPPARMIDPKDSAAVVLERTIADWVKAGKTDEAAALGTVYEQLVHLNYLQVPLNGEYSREFGRNAATSGKHAIGG